MRWGAAIFCSMLAFGGLIAAGTLADTGDSATVLFARDIRPLLSDKCFKCHGPDHTARKASLRLDTEEGIRQVFRPGSPAASPAFQRLTHPNPALRMPPPGSNLTLTRTQVDLIRRWIMQGAKWEKHWAFRPPVRPPVPLIRTVSAGIRNPIDAFVLGRLQIAGLTPSPQATRETLIRRVTLDLTGLPPTPQEARDFLADTSANAYEKLVDRLLASPRFGERWAWEWLEAARYADTNGYQEDRTRTMWLWRDWVVDALNRDMPFDQFTIEQIAGDLLPNPTRDQRIATGFNRNHMLNGEGGRIPEESRVEYVVDRVETTATTWLGLTLGCARCHDHKYDPFSQKEFYQLYAYFNNVPETGGVDRGHSANPVMELPTEEQTARIAALREKIAAVESQLKPLAKEAPERAALQKELDNVRKGLDAANSQVVLAMVMEERSEPRETHLLIRGAYDRPGEKVTPGVPEALHPLPQGAPNNRLGLARWLVSPDNPLTARVIVNRVWQQLFGTGLVKTAEDFGLQGEPPSHPELLDWLACEFTAPQTGASPRWSLKHLIRLIVTSATYRQSAVQSPRSAARDPQNRLLWRGPRFRWPSHVLRDQALALSGLLVEKRGGPSVKPYQPEGVWEDFSYGKITYQQDHGDSLYRRSLYTFWRRSVAPPSMFDTAGRRVCTVRNERTNTPLQALALLNDVQYVEAARVFAERMMKEGGETPRSRIAWAFQLAACRPPRTAELDTLQAGFRKRLAHYRGRPDEAEALLQVGERKRDPALDAAELAAFAGTAAAILNLDEVLCKE